MDQDFAKAKNGGLLKMAMHSGVIHQRSKQQRLHVNNREHVNYDKNS